MTIVRITKNRVLKAIKNEPIKNLKAGSWMDLLNSTELFTGNICELRNKSIKDDNCSVCAVGAVLRNILDPNCSAFDPSTAADSAVEVATPNWTYGATKEGLKEEALEFIHNDKCMSALSIYFEGLCCLKINADLNLNHMSTGAAKRAMTPKQLAPIRRSVLSFVEKNFPSHITIDIDGIKPAKDVKIIEQ